MKILSLLLITFLNAAPAKSAKSKDIPDSNVKVEQKAKKDLKDEMSIKADTSQNIIDTGDVLLNGGVNFKFGAYLIISDDANMKTRKKIIHFSNRVKIHGKDFSISCSNASYDIINKKLILDGKATLKYGDKKISVDGVSLNTATGELKSKNISMKLNEGEK